MYCVLQPTRDNTYLTPPLPKKEKKKDKIIRIHISIYYYYIYSHILFFFIFSFFEEDIKTIRRFPTLREEGSGREGRGV